MTEIEFRTIGPSNLRVSTIGLGCNNFGRTGSATQTQEGTTAVIDMAIELGVTLLDTADIYGGNDGLSETLMGVALRGRRDQVVIATKFGHSGVDLGFPEWGRKGSRTYIRHAVQASLRRLQADYIDLYQMHTPDEATPIEETIGALEELVTDGTIREYGNSNFSATQISDAQASAGSTGAKGFISAQNEYSLLARGAESGVLPVVHSLGLGLLPYFPLHNGLLTGKFTRQGGPADSRIMRSRRHIVENAPWDALDRLQAFCDARGITVLEASISWLLANESIPSVIAGVTHPDQLESNASAATSWRPTAEDIAEIAALFSPDAEAWL